MPEKISGSCLCGRVKFEVANEFDRFYWCHCSQCRKITGSAHASNLFTDPGNLSWLVGEEHIKKFVDPDRDFSKWFCGECGSGLPYLAKDGTHVVIPAGSLDGELAIFPQHNIFWADRATWYDQGIRADHVEGFAD